MRDILLSHNSRSSLGSYHIFFLRCFTCITFTVTCAHFSTSLLLRCHRQRRMLISCNDWKLKLMQIPVQIPLNNLILFFRRRTHCHWTEWTKPPQELKRIVNESNKRNDEVCVEGAFSKVRITIYIFYQWPFAKWTNHLSVSFRYEISRRKLN